MAETPTLGLEIPAFGALAAFSAATLGATRIELNAEGSYGEGGLTPSVGDLKEFISTSSQRCPLRIMIRPRGPPRVSSSPEAEGVGKTDFIYTDEEFKIMEASIKEFKESGLLDASKGDGFVFGILRESTLQEREDPLRGQRCWVDGRRCTHLVQAAKPFKCVFHRAFDEIISGGDSHHSTLASWKIGLDTIAACGFNAILTSGGLGKAIDHIETLEGVIEKAKLLKIEIIIGGGVRTTNIDEMIGRLVLWEEAGSVYFHSACLRGTGNEDINPEEVQGILDELRSAAEPID